MTTPPRIPSNTWGADCESVNYVHLPQHLPVLWPYLTGTADVIWSSAQVAHVAPNQVIWVDQGFQEVSPLKPDEFDIEAGAIPVGKVPAIVITRQEHRQITRLYGTWGTYAQVKEELAYQEALANVWWRISDWNLSEAAARAALLGDVYAVQWASPTSNPNTRLPGTPRTLLTAGADLSVMLTAPLTWRD